MQYTGEIIQIIPQTPDVRTFRISRSPGFDFIPGQYCLITFIDKPEFFDENRPFTLCTSPTQQDYIEFTIKEMGTFTKALFSLKQGDKLQIDGPYGKSLNFDESVKDNIVFLAGGSGITPFMSALRYAVAKNLPNRMILLFSNRTEKDIIYRSELEAMNKGKIKVIHTVTNEIPESWKGATGWVDKNMIEKYVKQPVSWLWYLCGPPPMIISMKKILLDLHIQQEKIRIEEWQIPGKA